MSSIAPLTKQQSDSLTKDMRQIHEEFGHQIKMTGCSIVAASFLLVGALIVIGCGSLCLMLPGVNVINHVILPAIIPGICGIIASIPFIVLSVRKAQDKNKVRKQMIETMVGYLDTYNVPDLPKKQRAQFILKYFLNWKPDPNNPEKLVKNTSWSVEYQNKVLGDIKDKIGQKKEQRNPRQEKIATAIDKALQYFQKK